MNFIIHWIRSVWEQEGGSLQDFEEPLLESSNGDRSSMADFVRILQAQDAEEAARD